MGRPTRPNQIAHIKRLNPAPKKSKNKKFPIQFFFFYLIKSSFQDQFPPIRSTPLSRTSIQSVEDFCPLPTPKKKKEKKSRIVSKSFLLPLLETFEGMGFIEGFKLRQGCEKIGWRGSLMSR